jgi:hypothetical protein
VVVELEAVVSAVEEVEVLAVQVVMAQVVRVVQVD